MMDTSYLLMALRSIRDEKIHEGIGIEPYDPRPWQYNEALDWIIGYVDTNFDQIEDILDQERERGTR